MVMKHRARRGLGKVAGLLLSGGHEVASGSLSSPAFEGGLLRARGGRAGAWAEAWRTGGVDVDGCGGRDEPARGCQCRETDLPCLTPTKMSKWLARPGAEWPWRKVQMVHPVVCEGRGLGGRPERGQGERLA